MNALLGRLAVVVVVLTTGCGLGPNPGAQLKESVEDYVRSMRWGHIERAANYVPQALRSQFIRQKRLAQSQLQIHEYEIRAVEYTQGSPRARVIVMAVWSRAADPVSSNSQTAVTSTESCVVNVYAVEPSHSIT